MTPEEFAHALDRWGGNLATWPEGQRAAATALLETSPEARRELEAMQAVERALVRTRLRRTPPLDDLVARGTAQLQERPGPLAWRLRYAACLAILAAGFAYGALAPRAPEDWFSAAFAPAEPFDVD